MRVNVFYPPYNPGNARVLKCFADAVGASFLDDREYIECDVAVIFGLVKKVLPASKAKGRIIDQHKGPVLVIERGFVNRGADSPAPDYGANGEYFSVGWFHGPNVPRDYVNMVVFPDRWEALSTRFKPWLRDRQGPVLVCGQVPWDVTVQDTDHVAWCKGVVSELKAMGRTPIFRPHPNTMNRRPAVYGNMNCELSTGPLEGILDRVTDVVTYSSTVAVQSVIAGIPTIAMDALSPAWDVTGRSLYALDLPWIGDRRPWAHRLAYAQWQTSEFKEAWEHVRRRIR